MSIICFAADQRLGSAPQIRRTSKVNARDRTLRHRGQHRTCGRIDWVQRRIAPLPWRRSRAGRAPWTDASISRRGKRVKQNFSHKYWYPAGLPFYEHVGAKKKHPALLEPVARVKRQLFRGGVQSSVPTSRRWPFRPRLRECSRLIGCFDLSKPRRTARTRIWPAWL